MSTLVVASSREDAAAVEAVETHHAQLSGQVGALVDRLTLAAAAPLGAERDALVAFVRSEVLPQAEAKERTMYAAARRDPAAALLVDALLADNATLRGLADRIAAAPTGVEAAGYGRALQVLLDSHLAKENDLLLPLLAADSEVSVAAMLEELRGAGQGTGEEPADAADADQPAGGHSCGCGHEHDQAVPELDARFVPHDIRHATIFGALSAVPAGGQMVLVAPHDPLPLLAQIEGREPGVWSVGYLERGPEAWRLLFSRTGA